MKNLLIVFTVLATASIANAALLISVGGVENPPDTEINIYPSDVVVIDVTGDGQTLAPLATWLISQGPGTLAGGTMLYPGSLSALYTYVPGSGDGYEDIVLWLESEGYADIQGVSYLEFAHGGDIQPPTTGTLADDIQFHCEDYGEVLLSLLTIDVSGAYDTQVIHQIPEPITFGLLGLGGLFLRRRK